jgi:hypothetical protein
MKATEHPRLEGARAHKVPCKTWRLSWEADHNLRRDFKPWDPRDTRDHHLGSAVCAWRFLPGELGAAPPGTFDFRFRGASDFYNYRFGLALTEKNGSIPL